MVRASGADNEGSALITLSTGVVLRRRMPSSWAMAEVHRQMAAQRPQPPMISNPDRGRMEPNEADPDYRQALIDHADRELERLYHVIVATATQIEFVPEGFPSLESSDWVEMLDVIGVPCPPGMGKQERYLRWVKYIAAPLNDDWLMLLNDVRRDVGTPEEDVAVAADTFRSDT